jgi:capsular polysaccharide biosynthesis protein
MFRRCAPQMTSDRPGTEPAARDTEYVISLRDLLQVLWRRLWVILLVSIVFTGVAAGYSLLQTPTYEGSIKILVGQERGITEDPTQATGLQQLTQTIAEIVNTQTVAAAVIEELGLDVTPEEFLENMRVEQVPNTQVIQVFYRHEDPQRAQLIANTIGDVFSEQVAEVSPSANAITATVWERASVPQDPVSPNPVRNGLLALMLGLMLGVALAILLEYLDDSWRSPEEVEEVSRVPNYAVIPRFEAVRRKGK